MDRVVGESVLRGPTRRRCPVDRRTVGFILKLLILMIVARLIVGVLRSLLRGPRGASSKPPKDPVRDKRQRARQRLDSDIVDAEFEDISDTHKQR